MSSFKKCILILIVFSLLFTLFFSLRRRAYEVNDGFSLEAIQFTLPYNRLWEIPPLSHEEKHLVDHVLSQPFTYLGKGARSYAFLSQDGQYVVKFFKYRYHVPHWAVRWLPSIPPFELFRQRKIKKVSLDTVLSGYKVAYMADREGCGLLYIHLNETEGHPQLLLTDKQGKSHRIDLNDTRFVVQKKVVEAEEELALLFQQRNLSLVKERIRALFSLYRSHYQYGVTDLGVGILRNNGFNAEGRPIHFDVGKMGYDERVKDPKFQFERLYELAQRVVQWVEKHYPSYKDEIREDLKTMLFEWYSER